MYVMPFPCETYNDECPYIEVLPTIDKINKDENENPVVCPQLLALFIWYSVSIILHFIPYQPCIQVNRDLVAGLKGWAIYPMMKTIQILGGLSLL